MNSKQIFDIQSSNDFEQAVFNVFDYQYRNLNLYKEYCNLLKRTPHSVKSIEDIPFLPISFFRTQTINSSSTWELFFESSGTTSENTSRHYIADVSLYEQSFINSFSYFYGNPKNYCWFALMPTKEERPHSSLLYMVEYFVNHSVYSQSGFYYRRLDTLYKCLVETIQNKLPVIVIGLTYALLDFAEQYQLPENSGIIVIETGGMKGKRKELPRSQVHQLLTKAFSVSKIHSEYGMTELLSQAYSKGDGIFYTPPWMKIMIRDVYNPLSKGLIEKRGAINIIDLANIYSCSFIETEDLGIVHSNGSFEVFGRLQGSIQRGCNTMLE